MLAVVTVMMAAAIPPVRRKMFEVFYLLHHLYIILIVLLFFHVAKPTLHYFLLGPGCIYAMDRLYRFVRSRTNRPQILSVIQHPSNVIELRFAKAGMNVKVGQFIYLNIPSISWFQWHPFTLTSAPEDDELSVHIYVAGGWTNKLVEMFKQSAVDMPKRIDIVHHSVPTPARVQRKQPDLIDLHRSNSNPTSALYTPRRIREQPFDNGSERTLPAGMDYYASATNHANMDSILRRNKALPAAPRYYGSLPTILVDGPYGAPTQHVFDYENIMLIAGGIGITPMSSVLKSLYYQLTGPAHRRKVKKVYFFWICRDIKSLEWFRDLLAALDSEDIGNILEIRTYLTGQLSMDHIRNISLNQDSGGPDAITGLYRSPTYYGRPNFDKIFENVGMRNPDTDIGVFFCGSKTLGQNIRGARKKWNKELDHRNTKFHYHEEKSG
ncbi:hypothetical protein GGI07_002528 [Coemansia sp. Benny D115]|nr:hypothetical protein GGI07_002528 [Coemansia sp. Benny D115]